METQRAQSHHKFQLLLLAATWLVLNIAYFQDMKFEMNFISFTKPGLHEPQLQVEWSVMFLYSLVVERRC